MNPFKKPEIRYLHQDGYPPYPYVAHDLTFFNMAFRNRDVAELREKCNIEIKNAREKMLRDQIREIVREELAQ